MIKIAKSDSPPQILIKKGKEETDSNRILYDADPTAYQNGNKKFEIKKSIYGHKTVKKQLIADQFGKCCFCEADFTANGFGDIEHFRPKGGYQQNVDDEVKKPGYYWKAYEWDNLFFSCQICNSRYKKNYFPLEDESQRAICHHYDIEKERPLLVHPSSDDPEAHIGFRKEVCFHKDNKGEISISVYGLNRKELCSKRGEFLRKIGHIYSFVNDAFPNLNPKGKNALQEKIGEARHLLNQAAQVSSPFASMIRHNFPDITW
jgi:uncharacterized protein (TIGR02646 family)